MNTRTLREVVAAGVLSVVVAVPAMVTVRAQTAQKGTPDLIGALKSTPGVLGVEVGQMISGKQVIFAWFENKKAVLTWYYSDTHRSLQKAFAPGSPDRTPMADVPDDGSPVLAIASLGLVPIGLGWCLVSPGCLWLGYLLSAAGAALWAGVEVANLNLVLEMAGGVVSVCCGVVLS